VSNPDIDHRHPTLPQTPEHPNTAIGASEEGMPPMSDQPPDLVDASKRAAPPSGRDLVEAIAQRVVELLDGRSPAVGTPLLSALEVAQRFGVGRKWVYEHADDLGAIRLGTGRRARMRFNASVIEQQLTELRLSGSGTRRTYSGSSEPSELLPIYGRPPRR
jgi:hypothetical protein